ncbi:MAG: PQQ-binding-like beta-propeller repeat protein, partial [Planctomycetota bacterium]
EELRELQVKHPHSSLADNCLLEMARIVSKREHGALRSQTLLRSLTLRYPESEVLGEAYGMLLRNCLKSTQYRLAAVVLEDIAKKHPKIEVPWDGGTLTGEGLVARLMETEELKRASVALARALPVLVPPLGRVWEEGSDKEVLAQVVSDENCFDRGIGLAVRAVEGKGRWAAYGRITALRAFHTSDGKTLWKTKVDVDWCCGEYETGFSLWGRNQFRAIVVCSGSVVGLCHPEGILAFDLATGKRLWSRKWKRPATRQPNQWFDHTALRGVHSYLRQSMNQRPVFAAEAGRIFYYLPDGELGCLEAATGRDIWKASRGGYASGPIGLFGETVVVGTIQPNRISAYNILTGRKQYSKNVAGQYPSMPAYDRTRGRVFTSDGQRLYCRRVRDYKLLWRGGSTSQTHPRPWQVDVLPDGNVAATKYMRHGNQYGYGLVLYDGESGKLAWKVAVNRYKRKGRDYERVNMHGAPMFGRGLVFIRAQEYIRKREGKRYIQKRRMLMDIVDYRTGKKLRRYTAEAPKRKNRQYTYVYPISGRATARHVVMMTRTHTGREQGAKLHVISGETAEAVVEEDLPKAFYSGRYQHLLQQRAEPVVTVEGNIIVPTGKGLRCYGPAGAGQGEKKEAAE